MPCPLSPVQCPLAYILYRIWRHCQLSRPPHAFSRALAAGARLAPIRSLVLPPRHLSGLSTPVHIAHPFLHSSKPSTPISDCVAVLRRLRSSLPGICWDIPAGASGKDAHRILWRGQLGRRIPASECSRLGGYGKRAKALAGPGDPAGGRGRARRRIVGASAPMDRGEVKGGRE